MKHTLEGLRSLLVSPLDTVEESTVFGHFFVVAFYASKGDNRVVLHVREDEIRVGSSSTASNNFLGTADAYTRAAAYVRTLGMPLRN